MVDPRAGVGVQDLVPVPQAADEVGRLDVPQALGEKPVRDLDVVLARVDGLDPREGGEAAGYRGLLQGGRSCDAPDGVVTRGLVGVEVEGVDHQAAERDVSRGPRLARAGRHDPQLGRLGQPGVDLPVVPEVVALVYPNDLVELAPDLNQVGRLHHVLGGAEEDVVAEDGGLAELHRLAAAELGEPAGDGRGDLDVRPGRSADRVLTPLGLAPEVESQPV